MELGRLRRRGRRDGQYREEETTTIEIPPPWIASLTATDPAESRFGERFSRLLFRVHIQRKHGYYLQNVVHVLFGVATLALSSCTYPAHRHRGATRDRLHRHPHRDRVQAERRVDGAQHQLLHGAGQVRGGVLLLLVPHDGLPRRLPTLFGVGREAMQGTFEIRINEDDENEAFEYITKKKLNLMQDVDYYINIVGSCVWFVFNIWWHCAFRWKRWHGWLRYLKDADNFERGIGFLINPNEFESS